MSTHAVDHDQKSGMLADGHGDAILIVLAMANQTQIGVLDPQTGNSAHLLD